MLEAVIIWNLEKSQELFLNLPAPKFTIYNINLYVGFINSKYKCWIY